MEKTEFRSVEMVRRIRAGHAEKLRDTAPEDRIAFYREKARRVIPPVETASISKKADPAVV